MCDMGVKMERLMQCGWLGKCVLFACHDYDVFGGVRYKQK